jgi:hypothetical protein
MAILVSGTVRVVFEKHELEVPDDPPVKVPAYRCRWCGFTVVTDGTALPDHECTGPVGAPTYHNVPPAPLSHHAP